MHGMSFSRTISGAAGVVELVDALRSGRSIRKDVPVRVRPSACDENKKGKGGFGQLSPFCARHTHKGPRSAPQGGGSDVIRQRGDSEHVAQYDVGRAASIQDKLGGTSQ